MGIFLHLPKTAGMTVNGVLERQFPAPGAVLHTAHLHAPDAARQFHDLPPRRQGTVRAVTGHTAFGLHESLPPTYFTVLRDPVVRPHAPAPADGFLTAFVVACPADSCR